MSIMRGELAQVLKAFREGWRVEGVSFSGRYWMMMRNGIETRLMAIPKNWASDPYTPHPSSPEPYSTLTEYPELPCR